MFCRTLGCDLFLRVHVRLMIFQYLILFCVFCFESCAQNQFSTVILQKYVLKKSSKYWFAYVKAFSHSVIQNIINQLERKNADTEPRCLIFL